MDRSWMSKDRRSKDYADGAESFIAFALQYSTLLKCPCLQCGNMIFHTPQKIREHLLFYGIDQSYHTWYWHEDAAPSGPPTSRAEWHHTVEFNDVDSTIEMVQVAYDDPKKTLNTLGMEYEKIHACPNDCILYRNELKNATSCPTCGTSRWKLDGTDLIWHAQEREFDGKMRHPSDFPSWKLVDHGWPDFASEPRNLRLVISVDGVECYDVHQQEVFTLRVVLLWTINDFPAYGNLSGCVVKGYFACPICGEDTFSHRLKHRKKNSYTSHRRFLPCNHPFRKQKKAFNGKTKDGLNSRLDLLEMGLRCELGPSKVVDVSALDKLQNDLVVTLCLLEKYFPPSFFDIMLHLTVHLVRNVRLCGPVYLRWMYPFERFTKVSKGYVRNRNRPKGCIAECYIAEEVIEFCTEYLSNVECDWDSY
ncbi:hypothetical protein CK203_095835 [Vitis vinifera]|uniref:DUF4218 domain-containing protein n=1 Tax=Vitis vinifera TaxID=29760 RepID=A0A438CK98_VITVI|nr:hypothetical protein CK203_095835 [Vitis vinifera]